MPAGLVFSIELLVFWVNGARKSENLVRTGAAVEGGEMVQALRGHLGGVAQGHLPIGGRVKSPRRSIFWEVERVFARLDALCVVELCSFDNAVLAEALRHLPEERAPCPDPWEALPWVGEVGNDPTAELYYTRRICSRRCWWTPD